MKLLRRRVCQNEEVGKQREEGQHCVEVLVPERLEYLQERDLDYAHLRCLGYNAWSAVFR